MRVTFNSGAEGPILGNYLLISFIILISFSFTLLVRGEVHLRLPYSGLHLGAKQGQVLELLGPPLHKELIQPEKYESWKYNFSEGTLQINFNPANKKLHSAVIYFERPQPISLYLPDDLYLQVEESSPPETHFVPAIKRLLHHETGRIWAINIRTLKLEFFIIKKYPKRNFPSRTVKAILKLLAEPGGVGEGESGIWVPKPIEENELTEEISPLTE